ncbi:hypothetical protein M885DRAFT_512836 [Pelagophyceae sp. CCMP2097]|nr:hypothetical protein M885DRAFT_512836 [Pelagophyceae sp. CCMP2097]|mmetsp:Transcript_22678/g.76630  ORF Transcript_22678/g.76630 Transcript_22678/m.76630 type:complete len:315 (+) Transcript_22678:139-1083(+)
MLANWRAILAADEGGPCLALAAAADAAAGAAAAVSRPPFVDLTAFVDAASLAVLDAELLRQGVGDPAAFAARGAGEVCVFAAESQKYGDAIELCDRDTANWCGDAFVSETPQDDFKQCRAHRGDPCTWRWNANARQLGGLKTFAQRLPFFDRTGKVAVIVNVAGDAGVEHVDHRLEDLVSEFVWVRPSASPKSLYVRDAAGRKCVVPREAQVIWFDDHLPHCLERSESAGWSVRIDGRFKPEFRELVARQGLFALGESSARVLEAQKRGPTFLRHADDDDNDDVAGDALAALTKGGSLATLDLLNLDVENPCGW